MELALGIGAMTAPLHQATRRTEQYFAIYGAARSQRPTSRMRPHGRAAQRSLARRRAIPGARRVRSAPRGAPSAAAIPAVPPTLTPGDAEDAAPDVSARTTIL
jgi:hypothetical protein